MNKHLKELIEVANFDKQIDDLEPKISQARSELNEQIKQQEQILKNIALSLKFLITTETFKMPLQS